MRMIACFWPWRAAVAEDVRTVLCELGAEWEGDSTLVFVRVLRVVIYDCGGRLGDGVCQWCKGRLCWRCCW